MLRTCLQSYKLVHSTIFNRWAKDDRTLKKSMGGKESLGRGRGNGGVRDEAFKTRQIMNIRNRGRVVSCAVL